jgi:hypothetical protein
MPPIRQSVSRLLGAMAGIHPGRPPLLAAAAAGKTARVAELLRAGADVDLQDRRGRTALHEAARWRRAETAAFLLRAGASHTIADGRGHTALAAPDTDLRALHAIRQHYKRCPEPDGPARTAPASSRVRDWLAALQRDGIVRLPGLVPPALLLRMRAEFAGFVAAIDERRARGEADMRSYDEEEHWWPEDEAYVSNNAFKHSRALTELCCHPEILELVDHYYGRPTAITRGVAMRYLPQAGRGTDMFGWHHDLEDRRLKLMVLLTDVGERDQAMSYVVGSHRLFHPYEMFARNTATLEYCRERLGGIEIRETRGAAGDAFVFDSNGVHRGNRRADASVRDAFFVEFSNDTSNVWGGDVHADVFAGVAFPRGNPFGALMAAEKKWARGRSRELPTWLENLPEVGSWL